MRGTSRRAGLGGLYTLSRAASGPHLGHHAEPLCLPPMLSSQLAREQQGRLGKRTETLRKPIQPQARGES